MTNCTAAVVLALLVTAGGGVARADWSYSVIYNFTSAADCGDGDTPELDSAGNIYSAGCGGTFGYGRVFELSPPAVGQTAWTETVLFNFNNADGATPYEVSVGPAGDLYGTTFAGGKFGDGTVFELSPPAVGQSAWKETVLHSFDGTNGSQPNANGGVTIDAAGNLYSTTKFGGNAGGGVVFKLSPPAAGHTVWTESILHEFQGQGPVAYVTFDAAGNLYTTNPYQGTYGNGTVFMLTPPTAGGREWKETILHSFKGPEGYHPNAGVVLDSAGNVYGTATWGGKYGNGTIFELTRPAAGETTWTFRVLHNFDGTDGAEPFGGLTLDAAGNLYCTPYSGGTYGDGTVFELSPPPAGRAAWSGTVLHNFSGTDGANPPADLRFDSAGNLYGSAYGGLYGYGVVFELTP